MKEISNWKRGVAATTLLAVGGLGLTGCGKSDPNKLAACQDSWVIGATPIPSISKASAEMQRATSELIAKMLHGTNSADGQILKVSVADNMRPAAEILIPTGSMGGIYDTWDTLPLSQPAKEFCDDGAGLYYKTPQFVAAEQALKVAGIELEPQNQ